VFEREGRGFLTRETCSLGEETGSHETASASQRARSSLDELGTAPHRAESVLLAPESTSVVVEVVLQLVEVDSLGLEHGFSVVEVDLQRGGPVLVAAWRPCHPAAAPSPGARATPDDPCFAPPRVCYECPSPRD